MFSSQPSISAHYSLVLLLLWSFNCEWVEEVGLLYVRLLIRLVAGASSQVGSLSLGTGKTV